VKNQERSPIIIIGGQTNPLHINKKSSGGSYDAPKKLQRSILRHRNTWVVWRIKVLIYLYLNNYALCNGRKNIPRCILI
jgi:hypothetical protein